MDNYEKNYISKRPDNLCMMCGRCCRVSTTSITYEELKRLKDSGEQGAIDFLSIFEPYESIEAARKVEPDVVDNIINGLKEDGNYVEGDMTFYRCKYLSDDNLCTRYNDRLTLCKHFPASPWAIVPPGCGYEGWLFLKREEAKQKIRKVKEDLLELELLKSKNNPPDVMLKIEAVEKKMLHSIEIYKKHGAENW